MRYDLYNSIGEMLAPQTLSEVLGSPVSYVRCQPMAGGFSGGRLMVVELDGNPNTRLVLKHMSPDWDWGMRASNDHVCRSVTLWQHGLLDRLLPFVDHVTLACAYDEGHSEGSWAILMRDVAATLLPGDRTRNAAEIRLLLEALAAIHATFWQAPELTEPELGLGDLANLVQAFSPATGQRLASDVNLLPNMLVEGWELLQGVLEPDVVDTLTELVANPQPLYGALTRQPYTLVHGDFRSENLALQAEQRGVVVFDWQHAGYAAATVDLAWLLGTPQVKASPLSTGEATEYYRQHLARHLGSRFDTGGWQQLLELGRLVEVLRKGCFTAWFSAQGNGENKATESALLDNYNDYVRAGVKWL